MTNQRISHQPQAYLPSSQRFAFDFERVEAGCFQQYCDYHLDYLDRNRLFIRSKGEARAQELAWVSPQEWLSDNPHHAKGRGLAVVFMHGLTDNGFALRDLVPVVLPEVGIIRSMVLPDHGSRPGDMLYSDYRQWQATLRFGVKSLVADGWQRIVIIGHSLGGMLAYSGWVECPEVVGLITIAGAIYMAREGLARQTGWLKYFRPWLNQTPEWNPACYQSLPLQPVYELTKLVRWLRKQIPLQLKTRPHPRLYSLFSEYDYRVDSLKTLQALRQWWNNAQTPPHFQWYGNLPASFATDNLPPVEVIPCLYPERKLLSASHVMFPHHPNNPIYGREGLRKTKSSHWLGEYNVGLEKHYQPFQRLTYNPFFDDMAATMARFLNNIAKLNP